jgi:hypothetical protein
MDCTEQFYVAGMFRAFAKTRPPLSLRGRIRANRSHSGSRQDQAHGVGLPGPAALTGYQALVELVGDLAQRQAAGLALLHQPDHALLGLVLHEAVVLVVIAEGKLAGMGAVLTVFGDAAPTQGRQHHRAVCLRQPGDLAGG